MPRNTLSRRAALAGLAAIVPAGTAAAIPTSPADDPVYEGIKHYNEALAAFTEASHQDSIEYQRLYDAAVAAGKKPDWRFLHRFEKAGRTAPAHALYVEAINKLNAAPATTLPGLLDYVRHVREHDEFEDFGTEVIAAIEKSLAGMLSNRLTIASRRA